MKQRNEALGAVGIAALGFILSSCIISVHRAQMLVIRVLLSQHPHFYGGPYFLSQSPRANSCSQFLPIASTRRC
jgi:hypothetical protein